MKGEVLLREVVGLYKLIQLIDAGRWEIENILVISQWEMGDLWQITPSPDGRWEIRTPLTPPAQMFRYIPTFWKKEWGRT